MADTKTREQILTPHIYYMKKFQGVPDYLCDMVTFNDALAAMSEYSSHQNKELLERIKELEEGLQPFLELAEEVIKCKGNSRGLVYGFNKATISIDHCRKLTQLLNNKTDKV